MIQKFHTIKHKLTVNLKLNLKLIFFCLIDTNM